MWRNLCANYYQFTYGLIGPEVPDILTYGSLEHFHNLYSTTLTCKCYICNFILLQTELWIYFWFIEFQKVWSFSDSGCKHSAQTWEQDKDFPSGDQDNRKNADLPFDSWGKSLAQSQEHVTAVWSAPNQGVRDYYFFFFYFCKHLSVWDVVQRLCQIRHDTTFGLES